MDIDDPLEGEGTPKWIAGVTITVAIAVAIGVAYVKNTPGEEQVQDVAFVEEEFDTSAPSTNSLLTPVTAILEVGEKNTENPFVAETPANAVGDKILDLYTDSPEEAASTTPVETVVQTGPTETPDEWLRKKTQGSDAPAKIEEHASSRIFASPITHDDYRAPAREEASHYSASIGREDQLHSMLLDNLTAEGSAKTDTNTIGALLGSYVTASRAVPTGSRHSMLSRGKTLPCVLETAVHTDLPGITRCIITRPVFSDNGHRLLLPRGTVATGEYQGGIKRGVNRIFVVWTRLRTPGGVIIELAAPAVGPQGASGVHAKLNTHFWTRFGSSMLLSIIGGLGATQDNSEGSPYGASAEAFNRTAEMALKESIGIKTTGSVPVGSLINIMVAEDINFDLVARNVQ